jgi:hypothetical protein
VEPILAPPAAMMMGPSQVLLPLALLSAPKKLVPGPLTLIVEVDPENRARG